MADDAPIADALAGRVVGGRWRLERAIGSGATAVVYAARDADGTLAAVKLLNPEMAARADIRRRFEREGRVVEGLSHPNVVSVFDQDTRDPEHAYIAMELLEGETLADRAKHGRLPVNEILGYADQILDVLTVAHSKGVIHRDLKPHNLFLTRDGHVKLLDFGLARLLDPDQHGAATQEGTALGTAPYMAPEQALGKIKELDARADLFSLGAILFRLVAGRRVHEADTDAQVLALMASRPAPPLASVCPDAPPGVAALIDVSLGFSKESRYRDAHTMQEDVRALLSGAEPRHALACLAARDQATVVPGASLKTSTDAVTMPDSADPALGLVGRVVADRYRVEQLLGSGGMGAVYRAQHVHMKKNVALKVLHPEMTCLPEVVARFEREAVAAARIEHPNVATAKDFGRLEDGSFYLVLEYVEGVSLRALIDRERVLEPARAVAIGRQIASALGAAHAAGIVHRDLKPDNVMLVARPDQPESVKVLDFGIAKLSADETRDQPALTRFGSVFGTPAYMSPEQAMGQPVDARADLYALGILLYEMVSGRPPFSDDEMIVVLTKQMTEAPPALPATLAPALSTLITRLLAKSPPERPASADEVLTALDALVLTPAPPAVSLAGGDRTRLGLSDTVLSVSLPGALASARLRALRDALAGVSTRLANAGALASLSRPVRIGTRTMPLWWLLAGGAGVLLISLWMLGVASTSQHAQEASATTSAHAPDEPRESGLAAAYRRVVGSTSAEQRARAANGDREALASIDEVPAGRRSGEEWRALVVGRGASGELERAVTLAREAMRAHPELANDEGVLGLLRRAAGDREMGAAALGALEDAPGSAAADVIFMVADEGWLRRERPELYALARQKLESAAVRAKASPALRVALELEGTRKCEELKPIVERAAEQADRRSESRLRRLTVKRGCGGFLRRGDCYPCLRSGDALERALRRARETPAPSIAPHPSADPE